MTNFNMSLTSTFVFQEITKKVRNFFMPDVLYMSVIYIYIYIYNQLN